MKNLLLITSFFASLFGFNSTEPIPVEMPTTKFQASIIEEEPAPIKATKEVQKTDSQEKVVKEKQEEEVMKLPESSLKPNEWNRIPILEYHNIGPTEQRWTRQYDNFKGDLEWLYNNDYVLISIDDFARSHFNIPAGKKPVVLTFDDGKQNQFNLLEDGSIDPNCAIGILDEFYKKHPDFGRAAVFYVNHTPFGQKERVKEKLNYLIKTGRQVGYHTLNHTKLSTTNAEGATAILNEQLKSLNNNLPTEKISRSLAYPHGAVPKGNLSIMNQVIDVGLLVGADPAYPLYHSRGNAYRTPRIQAIDDEWLRHFGRKAGETHQTNSERFKPFISDGDPSVTTPENLN